MAQFSRFRRPLIIVVVVVIIDFIGRLAFRFQMKSASLLEAVLFALAAVLLIWPTRHEKVFALDFWLAVVFGLGSLRAALWAAGLAVGMANLVVFGVFLLAVIGYAIQLWVFRRRPAASTRSSTPESASHSKSNTVR